MKFYKGLSLFCHFNIRSYYHAFLNYIIKDDVDFINIYLVYALFLMQTISSYLFLYKYTYKSGQEYLIVKIGYLIEILVV